jgi:hypothetical protein
MKRRSFLLTMKLDIEKMKKPAGYAAAGAGAALVAAMFVPASALLALGAATVGAAYLYGEFKGDVRCGDCCVDGEDKEDANVNN